MCPVDVAGRYEHALNLPFPALLGHVRLKKPSPSDIRPGLRPVPALSKTRAEGLKPGDVYRSASERRQLIYLGTEHHAFVDKEDFDEWSKALYNSEGYWYTKTKAVTKKDWDKITLDLSSHLEWAIGMVWPDQSYVSLRWYRGGKNTFWSQFHLARLDILAGEFIHPA